MPVFSDHSDEMQQMMGRIPGWIVRWGLWVIAIFFLLIVAGCYFIKYPQTVSGPVQLTAYNPPAELLAVRSGRVAGLFVAEGEEVVAGQAILVLESAADYGDVIALDSLLRVDGEWTGRVFDDALYREYKLGDLQSPFLQFQRECASFRERMSSTLTADKERLLREQIAKQEELLAYQKQQAAIGARDFELARKDFARDSVMFAVEGISLADFERARQAILQKEAAVIGHRSAIGATEASLLAMRGSLVENKTQDESQIKTLTIELDRLYRQLVTQVDVWKRDYLLTAPVGGRVFLANVWSENQNVAAAERIATIVPGGEAAVMGRMSVPFSGYSKIETGQQVNIRLDNYPHMEFGMVKGRVRSVSPIPEETGYGVEIDFPDGLTTSYGVPVSYVYKMTGTADVITRDMRLIEQFVQPLRAVFDKI